MTTNFYKIDPNATEEQRIDLPVDSVVYIGMDCNAVSDLYFPQLNLGDNSTFPDSNPFNSPWDKTKEQFCKMNGANYPKAQVTPKFNTICNRFWTGFEPFNKSFSGILYGHSRTISAETTTESLNYSLSASDGNTYLMGYHIVGDISRMMPTGLLENGSIIQMTFADESGNFLGCANYYFGKQAGYRQGARVKYTILWVLAPETIIGNIPLTVIPFTFAYVRSYYSSWTDISGTFITDQVTQLSEPITISGVPDVSYTWMEQPITFPMRITADERSYSYIHF